MKYTRYKNVVISHPSFRRRNKCKKYNCKSVRYLSIYDENDELRYCLVHLIDNTDDIESLPEDAREEIDEVMKEDSHTRNIFIEKLQDQKRRSEIKRLNILSDALNNKD